jgi:hypothetical protein
VGGWVLGGGGCGGGGSSQEQGSELIFLCVGDLLIPDSMGGK